MRKRYLVIDQNFLRTSDLETTLVNQRDAHCVLPDFALFEMTKSPHWECTLRASLATLSRFPGRVHMCLSVNEGMARELASLRPICGHLMFREGTTLLREILEAVRTGTDGPAIVRIRQDLPRHLQELKIDFLQHDENKKSLAEELIEVTRTMVPEALQKRLRRGAVSSSERLEVIQEIGTQLLPEILRDRGITLAKARSFMKLKPLLLRYLYLKVWRCLRWLQLGGFESYPPDKVTNQEIDDQYILSATFFHGFLSKENDANHAFRDLSNLLAERP